MPSWGDFINWVSKADTLVRTVKGVLPGGGGPTPRPLPVSQLDAYAPQGIAGPYDVQTPIPDSPFIPDALENFLYSNGGGAVSNVNGDLANCNLGRVIMEPRYEQRMKCDKGFVAVRCRGPNGQMVEMCMFKPVAKALKLWKPRAKPAVSAKDMRILNTASRTARKLTNIAKKAGALPKPRRKRVG